ncbi:hypothetical protein [Sphingobacterium sp.]|uniref:hypothetical protein n=1 Tax=Sphingobacterium sp. TaxID=341027 RepID=UPI0028A74BB9|nr:hypothetical protein [Sphingobacterium sp.]
MANKVEEFANIITKHAKAFFGVADSKDNFISTTLKDSTTQVEYSPEEGGEAKVASGGNSEPLSDGEHELSNGVKITVKDGKVQTIEQPQVAEELAKDNEESKDEPEAKSEEETKVEDVIKESEEEAKPEDGEAEGDVEISLEPEEAKPEDELKGRIAELEAQIEALKAGFSAYATKESMNEFSKKILEDLTAEMRKTPAQSFTQVVEEEPADKWLAMARMKNKK